ncbi:MAG: hypothetical protein ABIV04_10080 [Massilia sp.]|jgi:hypothetical protein
MLTKEERQKLEADREWAVGVAMALFEQGDIDGARQRLFDIGISVDGIADYFAAWGSP